MLIVDLLSDIPYCCWSLVSVYYVYQCLVAHVHYSLWHCRELFDPCATDTDHDVEEKEVSLTLFLSPPHIHYTHHITPSNTSSLNFPLSPPISPLIFLFVEGSDRMGELLERE